MRTVLLREVREVGPQHAGQPELMRCAAEERCSRGQLRMSKLNSQTSQLETIPQREALL